MTGGTDSSTPSNAFKAFKGATLPLSHFHFMILWYYRSSMLQAISKLTILAATFNSTPWYITPTRNTQNLACKVLYKDMSQKNESRTEAKNSVVK